MTWNEAGEGYKWGADLYPQAILQAPGCVPDLKPTPQTKAPGQAQPSVTKKTGGGSVCSLCSILAMVFSQELSPHLLQSHGTQENKSPGHQSQMIKGYPLGNRTKSGEGQT